MYNTEKENRYKKLNNFLNSGGKIRINLVDNFSSTMSDIQDQLKEITPIGKCTVSDKPIMPHDNYIIDSKNRLYLLSEISTDKYKKETQ